MFLIRFICSWRDLLCRIISKAKAVRLIAWQLLGQLPRLRPLFIACLAWIGLAQLNLARSDLDDFLRKELNSQSNSTPASYRAAIDRGVYYGGSYSLRNQLLTLQLLSFEAPYINAGCGGIDLYAGSFSFINKEQFNQLLKAIASNAAGYSFNLALTHVCPTCSQVVESLQRKIQQINQHLGNTCALAEGIVNDTIAAFTKSSNNKVSLAAHLKGLGDTFSTFSAQPEVHKETLLQNDKSLQQKLYGNLVFKALKIAYGQQFSQEYLEQLMSLTGTIISRRGNRKVKDDHLEYEGAVLSLHKLIHGGKMSSYRCKETGNCNQLNVVTVTKPSWVQRTQDLFLGNTAQKGIIEIWANNAPEGFTLSQRQELSKLKHGILTMLRDLAILSPEAAKEFFAYAKNFIALKLLQGEIETGFQLVLNSLNSVKEDDLLVKLKRIIYKNQDYYLQQLQLESNKYDEVKVKQYYDLLHRSLTRNHTAPLPTK